MKHKIALSIIALLLCIAFAICLVACNDDPATVDPPQSTPEDTPDKLPTATEVAAARTSAKNASEQNYNFKLNLNGSLDVSIFSGSASANYDGQYRFDSDANKLSFKRVTSGALLYDAQEYIFNEGDSRIKLKMNEDGQLKRVSVVPTDDDGLTLINLPFVALVDALEADNITNIALNSSATYKYKATIQLTSDNALLAKIYSIIGKMESQISFKDVTFTNPVSGITFEFNLGADNKLTDFKYSAQIQFPVKAVDATLTLTYSQYADSTPVNIPAHSGLIFGAQVAQEVNAINAALRAYRSDPAYSIDMNAENDFDPAWNINAIVDKYTSRMYKNTYTPKGGTEFVAFNKSYKYRNHTEEDGKEAYKYTDGNVEDDSSVWRVDRRGTNTESPLNGVTADSLYDEQIGYFTLDAATIDCIEKTQKNGATVLSVHVKDAKTIQLINSIVALINSNPTDEAGVIKIQNHLNTAEYIVDEAIFKVTMQNGKIVSVEFESELIYSPVGGDYTENNVHLKNSINIYFDQNLKAAQDYEAPDKVGSTSITGLKNPTKYIL